MEKYSRNLLSKYVLWDFQKALIRAVLMTLIDDLKIVKVKKRSKEKTLASFLCSINVMAYSFSTIMNVGDGNGSFRLYLPLEDL